MDVLVVRASGRESEEILKWVRDYYVQQGRKGLPGVSLSVKEKPKAKRPYLKTRDGTVIETIERIKKYISDFVPRLIALQPPPPPPRPEPREEEYEDYFDYGDPSVPIKDEDDEEDAEVKRRSEEIAKRFKPAGARPAGQGDAERAPEGTRPKQGAKPAKRDKVEEGSDEEEEFADSSLYDYWEEEVSGNKGE